MVQIQLPSREPVLHRASFAGLMDLFDANYYRIERLQRFSDSTSRSRARGSPDLFAEVIERHPYTTELRLTYCFADGQGGRRDPNAHIRIYHDARQAELIACHPGRHFREMHAPWVPSRDEMRRRWVMNRFLHKWLGYLLHMGHRRNTFRPVSGLPGRVGSHHVASRIGEGSHVGSAHPVDNGTLKP